VDLRAVKAARRTELSACAFAAARNAQGLLHDAEVLARSGSAARAYSLAALAVEECGKAAALGALAVLPKTLRMQAPVGRLLEWHQLKQVGGLLIAVMTWDAPGLASRLAAMPAAQVTQIVCSLNVPAEEADRLKRRGLYVDMDRSGQIREPSEITEAEVTSQVARARQAADSVGLLLAPQAQAQVVNPPAEAIELARALVSVLTQAGHARTPEAAVEVMLNAVSKFRNGMAVKEIKVRLDPCCLTSGYVATSCRGPDVVLPLGNSTVELSRREQTKLSPARLAPDERNPGSGAAAHAADHVVTGKAMPQVPLSELIEIDRIGQIPRRLIS
jgi:AbiV family abortive infection protein